MNFKKLGFLALFVQALLINNYAQACGCQGAAQVPDLGPQPVGTIPDQTLFANSTDCGPNSLSFDLTPYFDSLGQPLSYCLSNLLIDGDVSNLNVTVNPFTGLLTVPLGWFGVNTTIHLTFVGKNPFGSAMQHMQIFLEPCGG